MCVKAGTTGASEKPRCSTSRDGCLQCLRIKHTSTVLVVLQRLQRREVTHLIQLIDVQGIDRQHEVSCRSARRWPIFACPHSLMIVSTRMIGHFRPNVHRFSTLSPGSARTCTITLPSSTSAPDHAKSDAASIISANGNAFKSMAGKPLSGEGVAKLLRLNMPQLDELANQGRLDQQQLTGVRNLLSCCVHSGRIVCAPLVEGACGEIQPQLDPSTSTARFSARGTPKQA